jgi:hypothetical protein
MISVILSGLVFASMDSATSTRTTLLLVCTLSGPSMLSQQDAHAVHVAFPGLRVSDLASLDRHQNERVNDVSRPAATLSG